MQRLCKNCKWRSDDYTSVCVNDESDHLADVVEAEQTCECWEKRDDEQVSQRADRD